MPHPFPDDTLAAMSALDVAAPFCGNSHLLCNESTHMDAPDVLSTVLVGELRDALHQNLHTLQEPYKEVFTLRIFADLPYADIARLFGKSDSWARVVFFRAKMMLINAIKEEPEDV